MKYRYTPKHLNIYTCTKEDTQTFPIVIVYGTDFNQWDLRVLNMMMTRFTSSYSQTHWPLVLCSALCMFGMVRP